MTFIALEIGNPYIHISFVLLYNVDKFYIQLILHNMVTTGYSNILA